MSRAVDHRRQGHAGVPRRHRRSGELKFVASQDGGPRVSDGEIRQKNMDIRAE